MSIKVPRKLIDVALPLDEINDACIREKSIRHGHPSAIHLWWARRPLAAARAILFAQMVNDPGYERSLGRGVNKEKAAKERERLFKILVDLVKWENSGNKEVLDAAQSEIRKSWIETCNLNKNHPDAKQIFNENNLPSVYDPFAGGGAIPIEGKRLGLNTFASDLNPVAVSINKSILQYPSLFFGLKPIRPKEDGDLLLENDQINGTEGLAIDVDYYGNKLKEFVFESLQSHFPKVSIDDDLISKHPELSQLKGQDFTVASWLWARTVKSPSPAHSSSDVPLIKSFKISTKQGKEAWVKVNVEGSDFSFLVRNNSDFPEESGTMTKSGAKCIYSGASIPFKELRQAGKEKKIHQRLMAIVLEGTGGKLFISPTSHAEEAAIVPNVQDLPANSLPEKALGFRVQEYGMLKYTDLFSDRQLFMLTKFSNSLPDIRKSILVDAVQAGMEDDGVGLEEGGTNATAYADLIVMYLGFIIDQVANHSSTLCGWNSANRQMRSVFARQTLSMNWDYAESNPFSNSSGSFANLLERQVKAIRGLGSLGDASAQIEQADASEQNLSLGKVISTDPPYYDNIAYADLSDFFYTWLRYSLKFRFPKLYSTIATPKMEELIANPYIRGGKKESELFFLEGMKKVLTKLALTANELYPVTIYYAFKQSETKNNLTSSTGWETFLEAVVQSGFYITGTWPLRTEKVGRVRGNSSNALASSIVLVCRKRDKDAQTCSRRQFIRELNKELPDSIAEMTVLNGSQLVAPVDLSQAIIGPGMSIFSKYKTVLEADGSSMSVSTALKLINRYISEDDFDNDTQFCIHWFETNGWEDGHFGDADILARAKGTSADRLRDGGIAESSSGVFKLIHWNKYEESWSLESDKIVSHWEILHHLIFLLNHSGETKSGDLLSKVHQHSDVLRILAYRLYTLCERKKWADDASAYNNLILSWDSIEKAAQETGITGTQGTLFDE